MTTTDANEIELLKQTEAAFNKGDFAEVRALSERLASSNDAEVRKAARGLRARVSVDPIAIALWCISLAFFLLVVLRYFGHGR